MSGLTINLIRKMFQLNPKRRHSGRDCRNPVAMEGKLDSPPCVLDTGIPAGMTMPLPLAEKFP